MSIAKVKEKMKPVRVLDQEAIGLIHVRASREGRSLANAAARTIIEALNPQGCQKNTSKAE